MEICVPNSRWKLLTGGKVGKGPLGLIHIIWGQQGRLSPECLKLPAGFLCSWEGMPGISVCFVWHFSYTLDLKCFCLKIKKKKKSSRRVKIFSAWIIMLFVLGWKNYLLCDNTTLVLIIPTTGCSHSHWSIFYFPGWFWPCPFWHAGFPGKSSILSFWLKVWVQKICIDLSFWKTVVSNLIYSLHSVVN